jgi:hypothetical protein
VKTFYEHYVNKLILTEVRDYIQKEVGWQLAGVWKLKKIRKKRVKVRCPLCLVKKSSRCYWTLHNPEIVK